MKTDNVTNIHDAALEQQLVTEAYQYDDGVSEELLASLNQKLSQLEIEQPAHSATVNRTARWLQTVLAIAACAVFLIWWAPQQSIPKQEQIAAMEQQPNQPAAKQGLGSLVADNKMNTQFLSREYQAIKSDFDKVKGLVL